MKRRSLTGPVILILIGVAFLIYNLRPDIAMFDLLAQYWPFLLILWGALRLMEVAVDYFRGTLQRTSFSGGEVTLIVLICMFGWGAFEAHSQGIHFRPAWEAFGDHYDYTVDKSLAAGTARKVVFENNRGNLHIVGGDEDEIKVTGRKTVQAMNQADADRAQNATPIEIVAEGDQIVVRTNQDRNPTNGRISEDLDVTVPRKMAIEAHGSYGDYEVNEIDGTVDLRGSHSDVRLSRIGGDARVEVEHSEVMRAVDLKGNLDLQGNGSDIELENIAGQVTVNGSFSGSLDFKNLAKPLHFESPNTDLRVAAVPGEINMDLGELSGNNLVGPIHLVAKSKDVKFENFTDVMELETERGDITLEPNHVPLNKIDVKSQAGQIELTLPDKANFQLAASTDRGEAVNDFGPPIEKQTDGRAASLKGTVGQGPEIHLTTGHGTVSVRKTGGKPAESDKDET